MNKKILSVLLCVAMLFSALSVFTYAATIEVEMDLSSLFDDDLVTEDTKEDGKDDSENNNDDGKDDDKDTDKNNRPSSNPSTPSKTETTEEYKDVDLLAAADNLYDGIDENNMPMVASMALEDAETFKYFTFIPYVNTLQAVVSEPMMSSVAHSVVLVKCPDSSTANRVAFEMAKNCNPAKWICVTADVVKAVSGSNIAMLLMTTEDGGMAETILKNFEKQFGIDNVYESKEASSDKWENPYSDVKDNDWFFDTVKFASENGIMNGVDNDKFAPGETLTRAMLVTILYRVDGSPEIEGTSKFEDVKGDEWYGNAVIWANQNGIVNGISDTQFAPSHPIKREQAAAIIYRYAKAKEFDVSVGENTNILSYDDAFDIPEYAVEAFQYVVGAGIITGRTESTLAGAASLTRAEAATIISRFINYNA